MRRSPWERVGWTALVCAATLLIVLPALGVLGTLLHNVRYVGLATAFVPWYLPWLGVITLIGGALAVNLWSRRRSRFAGALIVLTVLTVVGASVITARMTAAVEHAGADIDFIETFGIGAPKSVKPDDEPIYTTFDGEPLRLSIFRPAASSAHAPVLFYIHGGGWVAGDRHARSADLRWFADQGWLTIGLDYALSTDDRHLWDVTQPQIGCALAWIGDNAARYGGDPGRLSLSGDSAGGNLAINTAYLAAAGELSSSCGGRIPAVGAVSALYPVVDPAGSYDNDDPALGGTSRGYAGAYTGGSPQEFPQRYAAIASATHISAVAPPTLTIVGEADHLVPTAGAYRFTEQARAAGVDVELVTVPYADHVFDGRPGSIGQQAYRQLTARWFRANGQTP
ncbi:MAG TPA: alpha/beta hydrolase [Mycobacterium sp.]|nr:alpha/beta hydrolase [Mycobacterium sp.]